VVAYAAEVKKEFETTKRKVARLTKKQANVKGQDKRSDAKVIMYSLPSDTGGD